MPSSGRAPVTVGRSELRTRLEVWSNSSLSPGQEGGKLVQTVRVQRPAVHLSGQYTCKVATFFKEEKSRHKLIIFGESPLSLPLTNLRDSLIPSEPGLGPQLTYSVVQDQNIRIYCSVQQVFPQPTLGLSIYTETAGGGAR